MLSSRAILAAAIIAVVAIGAVCALLLFIPSQKQLELSVTLSPPTVKLCPGETTSIALKLQGQGEAHLAIYVFKPEAIASNYEAVKEYLSKGSSIPPQLAEVLLPSNLKVVLGTQTLEVHGSFSKEIRVVVSIPDDASPAIHQLEIWVVEVDSSPLRFFKAPLSIEVYKPIPPSEFQASPLNISCQLLKEFFNVSNGVEHLFFQVPCKAVIQARLVVQAIEPYDSSPALRAALKVTSSQGGFIYCYEVPIETVSLPYLYRYEPLVLLDEGTILVNVTAERCRAAGYVEVMVVPCIPVSPGVYRVNSSSPYVALEVPLEDGKPLYLEKNPPGGELYLVSGKAPPGQSSVRPLIGCWYPTGILPEYGFHRVIIPVYSTTWGGFTYNGTHYQMGWLYQVLQGESAVLLLELGNSPRCFTLKLEQLPYPCSPNLCLSLQKGQSLNLVEAEHVECLLFKVQVDDAPAAITVSFKLSKPVNGDKVWVGCIVLDPSFKIPEKNVYAKAISASAMEILYDSITMKLPVETPGLYLVRIGYQVLSLEETLGLTMVFNGLKPVNLQSFKYNKNFGVWEAQVS